MKHLVVPILLLCLSGYGQNPFALNEVERAKAFERTLDRSKLRVFSDAKGHYIVLGGGGESNRIAFTGDGNTFHKLALGSTQTSYEGGLEEDLVRFHGSPYPESHFTLLASALTLQCGPNLVEFTELKKQEAQRFVDKARFLPLPSAHRHSMIGNVPSTGEIVYVNRDASSSVARLFVGLPGKPKEDNNNKEGGTLRGRYVFKTAKGTFDTMGGNPGYIRPVDGGKEIPFTHSNANRMKESELETLIGADLVALAKPLNLRTPCDPFGEAADSVAPRDTNKQSQKTH